MNPRAVTHPNGLNGTIDTNPTNPSTTTPRAAKVGRHGFNKSHELFDHVSRNFAYSCFDPRVVSGQHSPSIAIKKNLGGWVRAYRFYLENNVCRRFIIKLSNFQPESSY
jgi:hypothetical protein